MKRICAAEVILGFLKKGQHIRPAPAGIALRFPMLIILRLAAHINHAVNGRAAAQHPPAWIGEAPAIQPGFLFGGVTPVGFGIAHAEQIADRYFRYQIFIFAAGFQQQNFMARIFGQPIGKQTSCRSRADNDVIKITGQLGLPVADKPDSQDICFVPNGDYAGVIQRMRPDCSLPGEIVDMTGQVIGQHQGVLHYTVGQRRGLGVATGEPLYVVKINADSRQVVVGPRAALATRIITLQEVNWLGDQTPSDAMPILARIRSTSPPVPAMLSPDGQGGAQVELAMPEEGVSPGQACVFYGTDDMPGRVLGGGWIAQAD